MRQEFELLPFLPPPLRLSPELRWLLLAACGAEPVAGFRPIDGAVAVGLARRFEVSGRIAARGDAALLAKLMGPRWGDQLRDDFLAQVAFDSAASVALARAHGAAAELGVELVLLKQAALRASGLIQIGERMAADLDVLVEAEWAERFWVDLRQRGFSEYGARAHEHQLPALRAEGDVVIELHTMLPGLKRPGAERFLRLQDLRTGYALRQVSFEGRLYHVPSTSLLVAHALAHGLRQNLGAPQSYSLLRMLMDVVDIARNDASALPEACDWLGVDARPTCVDAEQLCAGLLRGELHSIAVSESRLLRHCVAAALDHDYARRLRLFGMWWPLSERNIWYARAGRLVHTLVPSALELEAIEGAMPNAPSRVGRRLWRPFELMRRAVGTLLLCR